MAAWTVAESSFSVADITAGEAIASSFFQQENDSVRSSAGVVGFDADSGERWHDTEQKGIDTTGMYI